MGVVQVAKFVPSYSQSSNIVLVVNMAAKGIIRTLNYLQAVSFI